MLGRRQFFGLGGLNFEVSILSFHIVLHDLIHNHPVSTVTTQHKGCGSFSEAELFGGGGGGELGGSFSPLPPLVDKTLSID